MNYLGHFYLSHHNDELLAGNFLADFIKGKKYLEYSEGIAEGIMMHRRIDSFTDSHPSFLACRKMLSADFRHYSGIIVDLYFDHFLAAGWQEVHPSMSLDDFSSSSYQKLNALKGSFPVHAVQVLYYMEQYDWIGRYTTTEGIGSSLRGIGKRLRYPFPLENSIDNLEREYDVFKGHFEAFLVDLKSEFKS